MAVVGVVLLIVAVLLFLFALLGGGGSDTFGVLGVHVTMSAAAVFLLGVAATVIALLGLGAMRSAARRSRDHRRDRKKVDRLSRELEHARRDAGEEPEESVEPDRPTPI